MRTFQKRTLSRIVGFLGASAFCLWCVLFTLDTDKMMNTETPAISVVESTSDQSTLACRRLPAFDINDWEVIHNVFAQAPAVTFGQPWRSEPQPRFLPGQVRIGFDDKKLWVYAEMEDVDIFNPSRVLNEFAYEWGDVFEVFLRPLSGEPYIEFHVTPENQKLPLWFPRAKQGYHDPGWKWRYLEQSAFSSQTQLLPEENRWRVLVEIPFTTLGLGAPVIGEEWLFSFGRYDYTRGLRRPVISSTSPHRYPDFHRQHEWKRFVFEEKTVSLQAHGLPNGKKES